MRMSAMTPFLLLHEEGNQGGAARSTRTPMSLPLMMDPMSTCTVMLTAASLKLHTMLDIYHTRHIQWHWKHSRPVAGPPA